MTRCTALLWTAMLGSLWIASSVAAQEPARFSTTEKIPILLDTDLGDDVDDAFALALALSHPRLDLRGVTTVLGDAHTRALIACRLLHEVGRDDVPVAAGAPGREPPVYTGQMQYGLRPCYRKRPVKEDAITFLYNQLKARPSELTLVAVGPLTNVAALLTKHPDCKPWIKRIVLMGGSVRVGYNDKPPISPEWNIKSDPAAARTVFTSGVPLTVAPLDATTSLKLEGPLLRRVFAAHTTLTNQLHALYQLWDQPTPVLYDPVAIALCADERWFTLEELRLEVDDKGFTRIVPGKPNARVATAVHREAFLNWYVEQITPKAPNPPILLKATNPAAVVERGRMPERVHAAEDFGTDIERRWWMAGKLETKNVPPGGGRACRGVLTNDFDDRQGGPKAVYTAVIFNPVPGPPMGPRTRLSFRYWLKGTDKLRVQIYSLTNGYHRHLTLTGLPQGQWCDATVDMTQARRPDGSGGPLAADERIDDIQFYTDPTAELIIDDILLYEAAPAEEKRPFPAKVLFTGWFDTGRQGKEWPGTFAIVPKEKPLTWKAAKSVSGRDYLLGGNDGMTGIWLSLRGPRPLGHTTHLRFRYHLTGADGLYVRLVNRTLKSNHIVRLNKLKQGEWAEVVVDFTADSKPELPYKRYGGMPGPEPAKDQLVDALDFLLPKGAVLLLDDVLLYEPGRQSR
jgi:inosine-uridine nucleoside N-ribohydrolase